MTQTPMKPAHSRSALFFFFFLPLLLFLTAATVVHAKNTPTALIQNGSYVLQTDENTHSYHGNVQFIPASTTKLVTALAALHFLGENYRFTTNLYLSKDNDLYIEGGGDPFLTSEAISQIASRLKEKGVYAIHNLVLDTSNYNTPQPPVGSLNSTNPYDTRNGALVVNFNSLPIRKTDQKIISAEKQTPTLALMQEIGKKLPKGRHRINIWAYSQHEDISIRYAKELFAAIFAREGLVVHGNVTTGSAERFHTPFISYKSDKNLIDILKLCLKYSNNYVANQIFLEIGKQQYGPPATWYKARKAMGEFLQSTFITVPPEIIEGSGLSRKNHISAEQLITILEHLSPWAEQIMPLRDSVMVKSGTLTGVYCYAGYFKGLTQLYPFAILLNQAHNNRDKLLKVLHLQFSNELRHENPPFSQPAT